MKNIRYKIVFLWIIALPCICLVTGLVGFLSGPTKMIKAVRVSQNESVFVKGRFIFDDQPVCAHDAEKVDILLREGQKVAKSEVIAVTYFDQRALDVGKQMQAIDEDIAILDSVKNNDTAALDGGKIEKKIIDTMVDINSLSDNGDLGKLHDLSVQAKTLTFKRNFVHSDGVNLNERIDRLKDQKRQLKNSIKNKTHNIIAGASGYFTRSAVSNVDGFYFGDIDKLTVSMLTDCKIAEKKDAIGKIVTGFKWRYGCVMLKADAEDFFVGKSVSMNFENCTQKAIAARVISKIAADEKNVILVFEGNQAIEEIVALQFQQCEVIKKTYDGIKVPISAIRMLDDKMGVYMLIGSVFKFKEITPIYKAKSYYIIDPDEKIIPNDLLIVKAKNVEGSMVIN